MKYEKSCGAVVYTKINNEVKFVLVRQLKGFYGFPKGHVEDGETEKQTAIREVKEETNVNVQILSDKKYQTNYIIKDKNIDKDVIFFLAKPLNLNQKPQLEEVIRSEWKKFEDALEVITYERSRELLKEAIKDYKEMI